MPDKKKYKILVLIILISFISSYCFSQEIGKENVFYISLDDAIEFAYKNNDDIRIQEQQIEFAKASIIKARSRLLPKLNLGASFTHNNAVLGSSTTTGKKDPGIFTGYRNDNQLGLSLTDEVYTGGANIANLKRSKVELTAQEETLRFKKLLIEFEVKRLYYGLLLAYETERISRNLVDQAKMHYEDVKRRFEQGTSSKFDVLQSKVQVSKVMPELVKAVNSVDLITEELKKLIGINMFSKIILKDKLEQDVIEIKEKVFLSEAYINNPQMILKILGIDISKLDIKIARASGLPQIDASLNYNYRSNNWNNMFNSRHSNWSGGVAVTIPIFDAFSTKAKVEEAKARYAQTIIEKENLIDQLVVDIRRACLDLNEANTIIEYERDSIDEAREALKIANVSYDCGVGTNLDVLDAQVSLSVVDKNYVEGIYDYLMAKAFLDKTRGKETLKACLTADREKSHDEKKN
ncbi:MAG: TolC family protein [Candidatus Omnitrophota bacterium]